MERFEQLWHFRAPPGTACQSFDTYLPHYEDDTYSSAYERAVDYLDGRIRDARGPGDRPLCELTDYIIDPGPVLGMLA